MLYQERLLTLPCFNELLQHEFPVEKIASGNKAKNIEILENHGGVLCSGDPVAGNPTKRSVGTPTRVACLSSLKSR